MIITRAILILLGLTLVACGANEDEPLDFVSYEDGGEGHLIPDVSVF